MFTSTTTTREKALVAVAATHRAMERQECCKSQFKFRCFSCGEFINRGDSITKCHSSSADGMTLRFRGADTTNGLTFQETAFYQAETGTKNWVHIGCCPCYWDSLPEDSNEYSPPGLRGIPTAWNDKVNREFDEDYNRTGRSHWHNFLKRNGYPESKFMKDRIIHAVTQFQALWRLHRARRRPSAHVHRARARYALYQEMLRNTPDVGDHFEILFNKGESSESIYSGEVYETQYRGDWVKIKVKFHYDGEVRKYTGKKFQILKKECEEHKRKLGIEAKLTGRLNTARIGRIVFPNSPSIQDWRYHYPDGTVVE